MAVRALRSACAEHQQDLSYLLANLNADPRAAEIVPELEASSAALRAQNDDWMTRHFAVRETQSGLGNADEAMINAVRNANAAILDALNHNRRSQRFLIYFPRGLGAFTRASYLDQLSAVRALAQRCAQDPSPKIQEQAGLLNAAGDQMDAAFTRRGEALIAESASYGQLQAQKLQAIDACRRVGHRLAELYPGEQDRVRSYFRKSYRRARPTLPAAEDPTAATGTATPGTTTTDSTSTGTAPKAASAGPTLALAPTEGIH